MSDLKLASAFPALGRNDWMKRVEAVLKGASFEDKLVHSSADGIWLEPLYGQLAGPRAARAAGAGRRGQGSMRYRTAA